MSETLYATSHIAGNFLNPNNAIGNTPSTWAGIANSNSSETSRWAMGNPQDPLTPGATQTIRVLARKGSNTGNPSLSINLYEAGTQVASLANSVTITSTTGQVVIGTFLTSLISNKDNIEIEVVGSAVGGAPSTRNSPQIAYIELEALTAPQANDRTGTGGISGGGELYSQGESLQPVYGPWSEVLSVTTNSESGSYSGTGFITGNGVLTSSGFKTEQVLGSGTGQIRGNGALTSSGLSSRAGVSSVTGNGALTSSGLSSRAGVSSVTGNGVLTSSGFKTEQVLGSGTGQIRGNGALTSSGLSSRAGVSFVTGNGALTSSGLSSRAGVSSVTGNGVLTSSGFKTEPALGSGTGRIRGNGALTSSGLSSRAGVSAITGGGHRTSDGVSGRYGSGLVVGSGSLASLGAPNKQSSGFLSGFGIISGSGVATHLDLNTGVGRISGGGRQNGSGFKNSQGFSSIQGGGNISAIGFLDPDFVRQVTATFDLAKIRLIEDIEPHVKKLEVEPALFVSLETDNPLRRLLEVTSASIGPTKIEDPRRPHRELQSAERVMWAVEPARR